MKPHIYYISMLTVLAVWQVLADDAKTNDWGAVTNNLQMSISIIPVNAKGIITLGPGTNNIQMPTNLKGDKNKIIVNQPFSLLVRIKNNSTNETYDSYITIDANPDPKTGLSCIVISPSENDISPHLIDTAQRVFISGAIGVVHPNHTYEFEFRLSDLCKFDKVGTYKIIAKKEYRSSKDHKAFIVVSSPLNVSVIPGN
jgi:hypothetical protein